MSLQVVLLAGGKGSRLNEGTHPIPKPMTLIGGKPILWHIMKYYAHIGCKDFLILAGFQSEIIKDFFLRYKQKHSNVRIALRSDNVNYLDDSEIEDWNVTILDTGVDTLTAGRIARAVNFLEETFFLTYGDGLSDVNLVELYKQHKSEGRKATVTAVHPPARFGVIKTNENSVVRFQEKPQTDSDLINGGFFVFKREVFLSGLNDASVLEEDVLPKLASEGELTVYKHDGFWIPMDTPRDRKLLEEHWESGFPLWKVW